MEWAQTVQGFGRNSVPGRVILSLSTLQSRMGSKATAGESGVWRALSIDMT